MIRYIEILLFLVLCVACKGNSEKEKKVQNENVHAKKLLQGIWVDEDTDIPFFRVTGDTIYYTDSQDIPVYFRIIEDSLYMYGHECSRYFIDQQTDNLFRFHSLSDNLIKLYRSENPDDSLSFRKQSLRIYTEVTKRDSVVTYNGNRYRGYVYINPSRKKVIKTSYSSDGISIDNVYYDNIIHICVYEGKRSLYAKDIAKQDFTNVVGSQFLDDSILADMYFTGVDAKGFHYLATLCIPESSVFNLVKLTISFERKLSFTFLRS